MIKQVSIFVFAVIMIIGCTLYEYELTKVETRDWLASGISQIKAVTPNGDIVVADTQDVSIYATITRSCKGRDSVEAENAITNVAVTDTIISGQLALTADMPSSGNRSYNAKFEIASPESIYVDLTTDNGTISVSNMINGAKLKTTNGVITGVNLRGSVDADNTNGNVICDMAGLNANESANLKTTNGNVKLKLPADVSASFDITASGTISITGFSNINYTLNQPNHKTGTIGAGGGGTITLNTPNGNAYLENR